MGTMHHKMAPGHLTSPTRQLDISHSSPAVLVPAIDHGPGPSLHSQIDSTYWAVADARPRPQIDDGVRDEQQQQQQQTLAASSSSCLTMFRRPYHTTDPMLSELPNEVLLHILGYLDVNDLLSTSRVGIPTHW